MKSSEICRALEQMGLVGISGQEADRFETYLDLLLRWNLRLNLTAVRDPGEIVSRHFAESIQCARAVPAGARTLLDFGSGAGFPGLPCAICLPQVRCTLAESQRKKASFLRQVLRELNLGAMVHDGRVEALPASLTFDAVTLRAVDRMELSCLEGLGRLKPGGALLVMGAKPLLERLEKLSGVRWSERQLLAGSSARFLQLGTRL